jgi:hypothetical protein
MGKTIKISISGRGPDTDAPLVEDALDEIRDWVEILRGVEEAVAGSSVSAIDWRLTNASRNSPLAFEIEAFPRIFATNIDHRVDIVREETARGLAALQMRAERPRYFTNDVMRKTRRVMERVTNGLGSAAIDFGPELPATRVTPTTARAATRNVDLVLESPDKPYKEIGSIEGYLQAVERDGFGRRVAHVMEKITGEIVKCIISGQALTDLKSREIRDIWRSQRVEIVGLIHFAGLGRIDRIDADGVRFMRGRSDLPQIDDVIDADFTGGIESAEYIGRLRNGTLS